MLEAYRPIAPSTMLDEIYRLGEALRGRTLQHINSTRAGGGVAEILSRLVPLAESIGIGTTWDIVEGTPEFFEVTKSFHNALQGSSVEDPPAGAFRVYQECVEANAARIVPSGDVIMLHDPQPAYLPEYWRPRPASAIWRCHIDMSAPDERVWRFLRRAINRYRAAVFHIPEFARDLDIPQFIIAPSIDPLSEKNCELPDAEITSVAEGFGVDRRRPILLQVSRFDRFKDPLGVIAAYRMVRQTFDCQLVLAGGGAADDPEGAQVLAEAREAAAGDPDVFVLELPPDSHRVINALQRAATIVLQKSTREGFGLTIAEALWKGKPVIGGAIGGIPSQIVNRESGFLVHSPEGAAFRLRYLLSHPRAGERMGALGREYIRRNFLITRHLRDYLLVMLSCLHGRDGQALHLSNGTILPSASDYI